METRITVLGAGMVGVSCALELQRRGAQVTLLDRREPGHETSWGNAGVIARSSLLPFNHPGLWRSLPQHLRNRGVHLRYDPRYLAAHPGRFLRYLWNARSGPCLRTATALDGLIRLSSDLHPRWLEAAGESDHLRRDGWLFLYRSEQAFAAGAAARALYAHFGVDTKMLDAEGLAALEPAVQPVFARALWIRDAMSVDDPGAVVSAYARLFANAGGRIERGEVRRIEAVATEAAPVGWRLNLADGGTHDAPCVVVALGPWSAAMLQPLGLRVPMIHERGYHRHYAAAPGSGLTRPVCDVQGGYVLSPMARGLRLSSGVELAPPQSPAQPAQLELAERNAREAFPLGEALEEAPWLGARPTLPDCLPMIGAVPGRPGLWLAFGHQHIGFSTGPGSARLLGALMAGKSPPLDPASFAPARFLH